MTKLITWNCNMAFRRKKDQILQYDPEILVIQECENPDTKGDWSEFSDWLWIGENEHKGLGVFSTSDIDIELADVDDTDSRYILPVTIDGSIDVLGVWAMNEKDDPEKRYIGQIYTALQDYNEFVGEDTVVAGDFNWNRVWDESPKSSLRGNFIDTVDILRNRGLRSAYHTLSGVSFGDETTPTFFMHKNRSRVYHTDYIFGPKNTVESATDFSIGKYENWIDSSDHMPIMIEL